MTATVEGNHAVLRCEQGTVTLGSGWCSSIDAADAEVLARAHPPVLDIGCGPGRHVLALAERGIVAMGIDLTPGAVMLARGRGAPVLQRSIFARIPGAGRWGTALLLDGNIGIGADPVGLLGRVAMLLGRDGRVLVELDDTERHDRVVTSARLELGEVTGPWFPWTRVGHREIGSIAAGSGFDVDDEWSCEGRWFAALRRVPRHLG